ncbi:MAG: TIGR00159 family protein [Eubacteriaceae bacterium]|jgi:diadenylate cyclase|uniref:Diadenylate cyclase n=1 Tax=Candidatus Pseudoramibacter fermentans TaxID=2594427 RepID=A0A6L5GS65_9FIRM|nr:TIGR00159 family protein [Candidatus Pseudoramibacter fermentans]RRF93971.1 MAG: TIGR00159 family protein [Eubacteriaceae bacterium]
MENFFITLRSQFSFSNVIEILVITFLIYKILMWIRGTQAEQVAKGLIMVLVLIPISSWLGFTTLNYILNIVVTWAVILIVVVFQPELRSALEQLGNNKLFDRMFRSSGERKIYNNIQEIAKATTDMSDVRMGALMVFPVNTGLKDIEATGIKLNADISTELIENIFTPNRPLHDGAVIIDLWSGKIKTAGCLLPLTDRKTLNSSLGTRHRAGIGISEKSDAVVLIVSEETGTISVAEKGVLRRGFSEDELIDLLTERFINIDEEEEVEDDLPYDEYEDISDDAELESDLIDQEEEPAADALDDGESTDEEK